jgi:hypothetical protein
LYYCDSSLEMLYLTEDFLVFRVALVQQRVRVWCQAKNLTRGRNSVVDQGLYGQVGLGSGVFVPDRDPDLTFFDTKICVIHADFSRL